MRRRDFIALSSAAAASLALKNRVFAQQQPPAPAPTFETIRGNVGYFTGRGGTIGWLVHNDAVVAVDTQFPNTAQACVDGLKSRSGGRSIDVTFNTHHHGDHTGGNAVFQPASKR